MQQFKQQVNAAAQAFISEVEGLTGTTLETWGNDLQSCKVNVVSATPYASYHCWKKHSDLTPLLDIDNINLHTQSVGSVQRQLGVVVSMSNGDKLSLGGTINVLQDNKVGCEFFIASMLHDDPGAFARNYGLAKLKKCYTLKTACTQGYKAAKKVELLARVKMLK